jgi:hypothetical protein
MPAYVPASSAQASARLSKSARGPNYGGQDQQRSSIAASAVKPFDLNQCKEDKSSVVILKRRTSGVEEVLRVSCGPRESNVKAEMPAGPIDLS